MYRNFKCNVYLLTRTLNKKTCRKLRSQFSSSETTIELPAYKTHNLESGGPGTTATLSKDQALFYYKQMQELRRAENNASHLYTAKIIRGFCHLYNGQEACAVGMKAALRDKDKVITSYRCHAWTILMGVSPLGVLAELTGRHSGCSRGKGGSMHMYGHNFYGGNGIVGAQVPLGTGLALYCKYKNEGCVCLTLYGDGAANQGQVHESYNMALLWKLPVIYICENNKYGMGTSVPRASGNVDLYTRGNTIPGLWVDGMDVLAVRTATEFAIDHVLREGPIVLELSTYRYFGHSMSDPGISYRSREEVQAMREKHDPITGLKARILDASLATEEELKAIENTVKKEIDDATEKAKVDAEVGLDELACDVYVKPIDPRVRGTNSYLKHTSKGKPQNM